MREPEDRWLELAFRYLDGNAGAEDVEELAGILRESEEARRMMGRLLNLHLALHQMAVDRDFEASLKAAMATASVRGTAATAGRPGRRIPGRYGEPAFPAELHISRFRRLPTKRGRHIFRVFVSRLLPLCAAATVLVAVWHFGVSSSDQEGEALVGKLVEASGRTACISSRAELESIGAAVKALPEDTPADERDGLWTRWYGKTGSRFEVLRTGPDGRIRFCCADGSMVSVEGGSNVAITKPERNLPGDVQVWIESGTVSADVSKHEGQSHLIFRTPHAKAVIVGTRLELGVGPQSTRLAVHEGLVEFHRLSDGSMILVGAGEYAVCCEGAEMVAHALPTLPAHKAEEEEGTGLQGEYFDNMDFTELKVTRVDPTVNFDWGSGSPDPAVDPDTFSVRWTGQVRALASETYTFTTISDDGIRLWVNGRLVVNSWIDQSATEHSGTIALTAGQRYDVKIEYYENGGDAAAKLLWSSPSMAQEVVPQSRLYPALEKKTTSAIITRNGSASGAGKKEAR